MHPTSNEPGQREWSTTQHHELSLMCDDIDATVADLVAKGVELTSDVTDQGFGRVATLRVPGAGEMLLFEPSYEPAPGLSG